MSKPETKRLPALQILRAIAALAVVGHHILDQLWGNLGVASLAQSLDLGARGVGLFFVLSGFILWQVHHHEAGQRAALGRFAYKRVSRILPFTLIAATAWVGIVAVAGRFGADASGGGFTSWLSSAFLLPLEKPYPGVLWSLRHEALFYLVFLVLFLSPRGFAWLFGGWMLASALVPAGVPSPMRHAPDILWVTAFSSANLLFLLGILAAIAHQKLPAFRIGGRGTVLAFTGVAVMALWAGQGKYDLGTVAGFGTACAVLTLVAARSTFRLRWLEYCGDASFSIYLAHHLALPLVYVGLTRWTTDAGLIFVAEAVLLVGVGLLGYRWIETPVLSWLNARAPVRACLRPSAWIDGRPTYQGDARR
ncbi:acyltransferase [Thioclava sp. GXIMD4216]|uniref:acyltransferase family protein n=1 Tax=Thioclava sp. GXIMD4216 TaxID=3131929 RepID=UPI0030D4B8CF